MHLTLGCVERLRQMSVDACGLRFDAGADTRNVLQDALGLIAQRANVLPFEIPHRRLHLRHRAAYVQQGDDHPEHIDHLDTRDDAQQQICGGEILWHVGSACKPPAMNRS